MTAIKPLTRTPTLKQQLKWLYELTKDRDTDVQDSYVSSFGTIKNGSYSNKYTGAVCHAGLAQCTSGTEYLVSLNNLSCFKEYVRDHDWVHKWNKYVLTESPYRFAFVSPLELSDIGYVLRTDIPGNYLAGAIMMTRQPWDGANKQLATFWRRFVRAGIDPTVAAIACNLFVQHNGLWKLGQHTNTNHFPFKQSVSTDDILRVINVQMEDTKWTNPSKLFKDSPANYRSLSIDYLWKKYTADSLEEYLELVCNFPTKTEPSAFGGGTYTEYVELHAGEFGDKILDALKKKKEFMK